MTHHSKRSPNRKKARNHTSRKGTVPSTGHTRTTVRHHPGKRLASLKATGELNRLQKQIRASSTGQADFKREIETTKNIGKLVGRIGKSIKGLRATYRMGLYHEISRLYMVAQIAAADDRIWRSVCVDQHWARYDHPPKQADRADALRFVLLRAFRGYEDAGRKRASKFYCALKAFFAADVPASDLPGKIRQGRGIEALARANAQERPTREEASRATKADKRVSADLDRPDRDSARGPTAGRSIVLRATLPGEMASLFSMKDTGSVRLKLEVSRLGDELCCVITGSR
jgi:hypothetical protein